MATDYNCTGSAAIIVTAAIFVAGMIKSLQLLLKPLFSFHCFVKCFIR